MLTALAVMAYSIHLRHPSRYKAGFVHTLHNLTGDTCT